MKKFWMTFVVMLWASSLWADQSSLTADLMDYELGGRAVFCQGSVVLRHKGFLFHSGQAEVVFDKNFYQLSEKVQGQGEYQSQPVDLRCKRMTLSGRSGDQSLVLDGDVQLTWGDRQLACGRIEARRTKFQVEQLRSYSQDGGNFQLSADRMDGNMDSKGLSWCRALGHSRAQFQSTDGLVTLTADQFEYDRAKAEVRAEGQAYAVQNRRVIKAPTLIYRLNDGVIVSEGRTNMTLPVEGRP